MKGKVARRAKARGRLACALLGALWAGAVAGGCKLYDSGALEAVRTAEEPVGGLADDGGEAAGGHEASAAGRGTGHGGVTDASSQANRMDGSAAGADSGPADAEVQVGRSDAGTISETGSGAGDDEAGAVDSGPPVILICGNGRIDDAERCDVALAAGRPGACPTECPPLSTCTNQAVVGTFCETHCEPLPEVCDDDDGCCPSSCNASNDNDCSASCGDGIVQPDAGENCEPGATPCLTQEDCDDGRVCTQDVLSGSEANCNTTCDNVDIVELDPDDGCCPPDANANTDPDCDAICGNDVVESDEECDGSEGCENCVLTITQEQLRCLETYPADECRRCECIECTADSLACFESGNATEDMLCIAVESCGRESDCANDYCYCSNPAFCLFPDGPCIAEIEAAAGSNNPLTVQSQATTPGNPLYRANQLGYCSIERCSNVCP